MLCKMGTQKHLGLQETEATSDEFKKIQNTEHASIVEAHESTRRRLESPLPKDHEDHIAGKEYNPIRSLQFGSQIYSYAKSNENTRCKGSSGKWKKHEKIPAWNLTEVKNNTEVIAEARKEGRTVHFATFTDHCHLKKSELEPQFPKIPRSVELCPEVTLFRIVCSIYRARIIFITNDGCSSNGYEIKTTRMCRTSSRRNISLEAYGIFAVAFAQ